MSTSPQSKTPSLFLPFPSLNVVTECLSLTNIPLHSSTFITSVLTISLGVKEARVFALHPVLFPEERNQAGSRTCRPGVPLQLSVCKDPHKKVKKSVFPSVVCKMSDLECLEFGVRQPRI